MLAVLLLVWFSGIADAIEAAKNAPENEFGSWGEWLNLLAQLPIALVSLIIAFIAYRVTVRATEVTVTQVISEFIRSTRASISPDGGRTFDATQYTSNLVTTELEPLLASKQMMTPDVLARLLRSLSRMYALSNVQFTPVSGQQNTEHITGLPIPMVWINPYVYTEGTRVLKVVDILSLSDALRGKSLKRQKMREVDLSWGHYEDMDFTDADLRGAVFYGAVFVNCKFTGADLRGALPCLTEGEKEDAFYDSRRYKTPIDIEGNVCRFTNCGFDGAKIDDNMSAYFKNQVEK